MNLRLNEIPNEGLHLQFNQNNFKLKEHLKDVIDPSAFEITFFIKPIDESFEIKGAFAAQKNELCCRCSQKFSLPLNDQFHEWLMIKNEPTKSSKYIKSNHFIEFQESDTITIYSSNDFNLDEYLHEILAAAIPYYPKCEKCQLNNEPFHYDEPLTESQKSPFEVLKKIRVYR